MSAALLRQVWRKHRFNGLVQQRVGKIVQCMLLNVLLWTLSAGVACAFFTICAQANLMPSGISAYPAV